jgi:hypothetical protein
VHSRAPQLRLAGDPLHQRDQAVEREHIIESGSCAPTCSEPKRNRSHALTVANHQSYSDDQPTKGVD